MADTTPERAPTYSDKSVEDLWAEWKVEQEKTYATPEEEQERFEIFKETKKTVQDHNEKYNRGESTFYMGLNQFADRRPHEVCGCMHKQRRDEVESKNEKK